VFVKGVGAVDSLVPPVAFVPYHPKLWLAKLVAVKGIAVSLKHYSLFETIGAAGNGLTVIVFVFVFTQPFASVPVTV